MCIEMYVLVEKQTFYKWIRYEFATTSLGRNNSSLGRNELSV